MSRPDGSENIESILLKGAGKVVVQIVRELDQAWNCRYLNFVNINFQHFVNIKISFSKQI